VIYLNSLKRIKELIEKLNEASKAYYQENREIMSNKEYDDLYDELVELENETGIILSNSPTQNVGYVLLNSLEKVKHDSKMLSLDKTKEVEELKEFLGDEEGVISWKLDGLTVVLRYEDGKLVRGVTRGTGEVGEDITHNVKQFQNIPLTISNKGVLTIRGEAVIKNKDFDFVNSKLPIEDQYKNPRNLCSGTVRQLNNEVVSERKVNFYAFQLITEENLDFKNKKSNKFKYLEDLGFEVVEHYLTKIDNIGEYVEKFKENVNKVEFASDGLVLTMNDIEKSKLLGVTSKFPKDSMAFKWKDEVRETKLEKIFWSASRTGLINPVAIFEGVELEGTTVKQASLHNLSIFKSLELGIGDTISVYKANMIIPQILENKTKSNTVKIPEKCPVCEEKTVIKSSKDAEFLTCINEDCPAKRIKGIAHYVSRNAMNIEGFSESTIEKLIQNKVLKDYTDIYDIKNHKDIIINIEGLGKKSYTNLIESIEKSSKESELYNFIYALGIKGIGVANAKLIADHFDDDLGKIVNASKDEILEIKGIGYKIADEVEKYFTNGIKSASMKKVTKWLKFKKVEKGNKLENIKFVITGKLEEYINRDELIKDIETNGGKVLKSVTKETDFLINNDITSGSGKNKKAKELNVPIITEEDFIEKLKG
jgi:DNA ligase (NAD+)